MLGFQKRPAGTRLMRIVPKLKKLKTKTKKFLRVKRNRRRIFYALVVLVILALIAGLFNTHAEAELKHKQLSQTQTRLVALNKRLQAVEQQKTDTTKELQKKRADELYLRREINKLNKRLKAKLERKSLLARINPVATASAATYEPPNTSGGCGDNSYAAYIYQRESGCSTTARNAGGCYGIGQACPGSKIAHCGSSYSCQNAWFSSYANSRYGGWAGAYAFHRSHGWW